MSLPVLKLSGSAYAQGRQQGERLRAQIAHNLSVYFDRFRREVDLAPAQVLACAAQFRDLLSRRHGAYFDGVRGIADGAGEALDALVALNVRYEILYYHFGVQALADGCTAFAVAPERSANGHLWMGQNWDWIPQVQGAILQTQEDGLEIVSYTEAGIFGGKLGMNSAGLGLVINGLTSTGDNWNRLYKPFHVRCHEVLRARELVRAVAVVSDEARVCAANFLIAQAPSGIVDVEAAPERVRLLHCEGGCLTHANHFWDPDALEVVEPPTDRRPLSVQRQRRLADLLDGTRALSLKHFKAFLKDHEGHPDGSLCRHENPLDPPESRYVTKASVIMDLDARTLWLSDGQPCANAYRRLALGAV